MSLFNRNHPYLVYFFGLYVAGFKYPFNRIFVENEKRERIMKQYNSGLTYPDMSSDGLDNAWYRVEYGTRLFHDCTNFIITYTAQPDLRSYAVKFLCSIIAYGTVVFILLIAILVWSLTWN